ASEAQPARLRGRLARVDAQPSRLLPRAKQLEEADAALAGERAAFEEQWGEGARPATTAASEAAEVRGELAALRASLERARTEGTRLEGRLAALTQKRVRLVAEADQLRAE